MLLDPDYCSFSQRKALALYFSAISPLKLCCTLVLWALEEPDFHIAQSLLVQEMFRIG